MDGSVTKSRLLWCGLGLLLLAAVGCEQGTAYVVNHLAIQRAGWDTLSVEVQFGEQSLLGAPRSLEPQTLNVYLFNATYDTLYAGDGRIVPVADADLGDLERLMLEICGTFDTVTVCEQEGVTASPKRLRLEHDIRYPEDGLSERGSYDLRFVLERQGYETETWEVLERQDRVEGYLMAYVGDQAQEAVQVPFTRSRGRFSLKGRPHYDDFKFHLKSTLMDEPEAPVRFDVYAGINGQPALQLASVEKRIRNKTQEQRVLEVEHFVQQAAEQVLETLDVSQRNRARVYIDDWSFSQLTQSYQIEVEITWRAGRSVFGRNYELDGMLEVEETGAKARFIRRGERGRGARHWASEIRGNMLTLGVLESYVHEDEAVGAGQEPERREARTEEPSPRLH